MQLLGVLIAISLLLLAGLGVTALFMAGRSSHSANEDDPDPNPQGRTMTRYLACLRDLPCRKLLHRPLSVRSSIWCGRSARVSHGASRS